MTTTPAPREGLSAEEQDTVMRLDEAGNLDELSLEMREMVGDGLHGAAHPNHPWSGCNNPDLWYDRTDTFLEAMSRVGLGLTFHGLPRSDQPPPVDPDLRALSDAATPGKWNAHPDGLVWAERPGDPVSASTEPEDAAFIAAAANHLRARLAAPVDPGDARAFSPDPATASERGQELLETAPVDPGEPEYGPQHTARIHAGLPAAACHYTDCDRPQHRPVDPGEDVVDALAAALLSREVADAYYGPLDKGFALLTARSILEAEPRLRLAALPDPGLREAVSEARLALLHKPDPERAIDLLEDILSRLDRSAPVDPGEREVDWQDVMLDALCGSDNGNNPFYRADDDTVALAAELVEAVRARLETR